MSRSKRKTSIAGIYGCTDSDRLFKRIWHGRMRAMMRIRLHGCDPDTVWLVDAREAGNLWVSRREGKFFFGPRERPHLMRK